MDEKALAPGSSTAGEEADSADEAEPGMANENANFVPTKVNPLFLMMYGNVMASGKSYSSAIGNSLPRAMRVSKLTFAT